MSVIIPVPSDDNGNLMKILATQNLEFTVTSESFSTVMSQIYNPTTKRTSLKASKIAKTVVVNGNAEIHSRLATNGYSNYSVTLKSYFDVVSQLL